MDNCGLIALSKIKEMKGVSAFTLIHLAKDNGVDLKIFKVKEKDLPLVHRPAIFHAENHFEFIKNGEPLPNFKWTGFVLTEKSIGMPISHKDARDIRGEMPPAVAAIGAVIQGAVAVASAVVTGVGAAVSAVPGLGAIGSGLGSVGSGLAGAAATIGGPTGAGATLGSIGSGLGAAGSTLLGTTAGGALTGGTIGAVRGGRAGGAKGALLGGATGAALGGAVGGGFGRFGQGFNASRAAGNTLGTNLVNAFKGVAGVTPSGDSPFGTATVNRAGGRSSQISLLPGTAQNLQAQTAPGQLTGVGIIGTPSSNFDLSNVNFSPAFNRSVGANLAGGGASSGQAQEQPQQEGFLGGAVNRLAGAGAASAIGSALGPKAPGPSTFDPTQEFSTLRQFLGNQALPPSTERELTQLVNTPLNELATQFTPQKESVFRRLNSAFDRQAASLQRQFAQAGQNVRTSSELRVELQRIEQDRATALAEAEQELINEGISRGFEAKQFALTQSIQANQFDIGIALELADAIGVREQLNASVEQNNFNQFQNLMAQILQAGFGSGGVFK